MADRSAIEWTDATWNPIRARAVATGKIGWHCEHVSPGCLHCYAEKLNVQRFGTRLPYKPGHRKDVEIFLDEKKLLEPLRWRRPRDIFVCSMTDLFGAFVPTAMIAEVFGVMAVAGQQFFGPGGIGMRVGTIYDKGLTNPRPLRAMGTRFGPHRFQVLTKRSDRMRELLNSASFRKLVAAAAYRHAHDRVCAGGLADAIEDGSGWPLPGIWLGVSVEDQQRADERIPDLLATPAAMRFLSCEPLLGAVYPWTELILAKANKLVGQPVNGEMPGIDWLICGGESGSKARPMHTDWARSLRDQCAAAGVPFFFKQWGEYVPSDHPAAAGLGLNDRRFSGFFTEGGPLMFRLGKKAAGRLLDGREHNGMPTMIRFDGQTEGQIAHTIGSLKLEQQP